MTLEGGAKAESKRRAAGKAAERALTPQGRAGGPMRLRGAGAWIPKGLALGPRPKQAPEGRPQGRSLMGQLSFLVATPRRRLCPQEESCSFRPRPAHMPLRGQTPPSRRRRQPPGAHGPEGISLSAPRRPCAPRPALFPALGWEGVPAQPQVRPGPHHRSCFGKVSRQSPGSRRHREALVTCGLQAGLRPKAGDSPLWKLCVPGSASPLGWPPQGHAGTITSAVPASSF